MKKIYLAIIILFLIASFARGQGAGSACDYPFIDTLCTSAAFSTTFGYNSQPATWQVGAENIVTSGGATYYQLYVPSSSYSPTGLFAYFRGYFNNCCPGNDEIYFLWYENPLCSSNPSAVDSFYISGSATQPDSIGVVYFPLTVVRQQYALVIAFKNPDNYSFTLLPGYINNEPFPPTVCSVAPPPRRDTMLVDQSKCYTNSNPYFLPLSTLDDSAGLVDVFVAGKNLNDLALTDDNGLGFILTMKCTEKDTQIYTSFDHFPYTYLTEPNGTDRYNVAITIFVKNPRGASGLKGFRITIPQTGAFMPEIFSPSLISPRGSGFYNTQGSWTVQAAGNTCTWLFNGVGERGDNIKNSGYSCQAYTFEMGITNLGSSIEAWYLPDLYGNDSLQCQIPPSNPPRTDCGFLKGDYLAQNWISLGAGAGGGEGIFGVNCEVDSSCYAGVFLSSCTSNGYQYYVGDQYSQCDFNSNNPVTIFNSSGCMVKLYPDWTPESGDLTFADSALNHGGNVSTGICNGTPYLATFNVNNGAHGTPAFLLYVDSAGNEYPMDSLGNILYTKNFDTITSFSSLKGLPVYPKHTFSIPFTKSGSYEIIYTWYPVNPNGATDTPYIYTVACSSGILKLNIGVKPVIKVTASPDTLCLPGGSQVNLSARGTASYTWAASSNSNLGENNDSSLYGFPEVTTTYTVIGMNKTKTCADTATVVVYCIPCPPLADFSLRGTCSETCWAIQDESSNKPTVWRWTFQGGTPPVYEGQNPSGVCFDTAGKHRVTEFVSNAAGADSLYFYLNSGTCKPVSDFTVNHSTVCNGGCVTFYNQSTSYLTRFKWYFPGGTPSSYSSAYFSDTPHVCYADTGSYPASLITTLGDSTDTFTYSIHVIQCTLTAAFTAPDTICGTQCIQYTNNSQGNASSWQWNFPGGSPSFYTGSTPPLICYSNTGTYSTSLVVTNLDGSDTLHKNITVRNCPVPVAAFIAPDTICTKDCITVINNTSTNATSWAWKFTGGTPSTYSGATPPSVCYNASGAYTIQLIAANGNGADTITKTIIAHQCAIPVASFTLSFDTTCFFADNISFPLFNTSSSNATSWQWYFQGATTTSYNGESPQAVIYNGKIGTFSITLIASNQYGSDTVVKTITILNCENNEQYKISASAICVKNCITITNTSDSLPGSNWFWSFAGGHPATYVGKNPPPVCYDSLGNFEILVYLGPSSTDHYDGNGYYVSVQSCTPDTALLTASDSIICIGQCIKFTNLSSSNTASLEWSFQGESSEQFNGNTVEVCYNTAGVYKAKLYASNLFSTDSSIITITVNPVCPTYADITVNDSVVCENGCVTFGSTFSSNVYELQWTFAGGNPATSASFNPGKVCYTSPGSYKAQLIVVSRTARDTVYKIITVQNCNTIAAFSVPDSVVCSNGCISFTNLSANATAWQWTFTGGSPSAYSGQAPPQVCYNATGSYVAQLIVTGSATSDTVSKTITVQNCNPTALFSVADTVVCDNGCTNYTNLSSGNSTAWLWNFVGGNPATYNGQNPPSVCYAVPGSYTTSLIASNSSGADTFYLPQRITVSHLPQPTITQQSDSLICSHALLYQWYENDVALPGATSNIYIATTGAEYEVTVIDTFGCEGMDSIAFIGTGTSANALTPGDIIISPNPTAGEFQISPDSYRDKFQIGEIEVFNLLGELILDTRPKTPARTTVQSGGQDSRPMTIDLTSQSPGIYFVKIQTTNGMVVRKVVKE